MSGTQGPYQPINGSGSNLGHKRPPIMRLNQNSVASAQHDDLIKYIYESWDKVSQQYHHSNSGNRNGSSGITVAYYQEREPNPMLKDFRPFDLEAWWGEKVVQNITSGHQVQHHSNNSS